MSTDSQSSSPETTAKKSGAGLGFLTILLFLVAAAMLATPFLWGLKDLKSMAPDPSVLNEWTEWSGDMHLLLLHIPIGLFVYVFGIEILGLLSFRKFKPNLSGALFCTVLSSLLAIGTGYLLFLQGDQGNAPYKDFDSAMGMHMWTMILFGVFIIFSFVAKAWSRHNEKGSVFYPLFMLLSAAALGFGAHNGGALIHGKAKADSLVDFPMVQMGLKEAEEVQAVAQEVDFSETTPEERMAFEQVIKPILVGKCWECHAGEGINPVYPQKGRVKAKLLMTTVEELIKGGKNNADFPNLVPGNADESEMIVRVELDKDDDEFMPKGKEDEPELHLTEGEIRVMRWWIDNLNPDDLVDRPVKEIAGYESVLADIAAITPVIREVADETEMEEKSQYQEKAMTEAVVEDEQAAPAADAEKSSEEVVAPVTPEAPAEAVVEETVVEEAEQEVQSEEVAPAPEEPAIEKLEEAAEEASTTDEEAARIVQEAIEATEEVPAVQEETIESIEEVAPVEKVTEVIEEQVEPVQDAVQSEEDRARQALEELKKLTEGE